MIFADTAFWVGLAMPRDSRHQEAQALLKKHGAGQLVTSNHVRGESWTLLRRRGGHRSARLFLDFLEQTPRVQVVHVNESLEEDSIAWLRRHDERAYSFVDATSFALMRSLRIREALAFDGDFNAAGFVELRA